MGRSSGSLTTKPSANATPASAPNCASRLSISCAKRGDVSRVATEVDAAGANCVAWHARAARLTAASFRQLVESRDAQFGALADVAFAEGIVVRQPIVLPDLFRSRDSA